MTFEELTEHLRNGPSIDWTGANLCDVADVIDLLRKSLIGNQASADNTGLTRYAEDHYRKALLFLELAAIELRQGWKEELQPR